MIKILNEDINILSDNATNNDIENIVNKLKNNIGKYIDDIIDKHISRILKIKDSIKQLEIEDYLGSYFFINGNIEIPEDNDERIQLIKDINELINDYNKLINDEYSSLGEEIMNSFKLTEI